MFAITHTHTLRFFESCPAYRVAFGPAHHLPVVEPLGCEDLVEGAERELPLAEDAWQSLGGTAPQALLEVVLVLLLLLPELPALQETHHRLLHHRQTLPLAHRLTPGQLQGPNSHRATCLHHPENNTCWLVTDL